MSKKNTSSVLHAHGLLAATIVALLCPWGGFSGRAHADGLIYVPHPPPHIVQPPVRPHPRPRPHFPLQVTRHRVGVEVDDTLARTKVEETFHNPNNAQLEGVYLFPLPPAAVVSGFRMQIGGREVSGEVLEKGRARAIYEDIVRRVRDPGLLEYVDRGLFRASVFPIPARGNVEVTIEYSESLEREGGAARYLYPLDTGKYSAGDYLDVVVDLKLRSSSPIRAVHCPSHDVRISRDGDRSARVSFEAKRLRADKDFELVWNVSEDALAPVLVTHRGHQRDGFFFFAISPRADRPARIPPKDLIFVADTSGSMMGRKLEQAKKALRYCLDGLNERDSFNIVDFSTEARRFRETVVNVSGESKEQARKYVDDLVARGGTNLEEGLRFGLESARDSDRLQIVVLLTDGEPTIGVTRPEELLRSVRDHNKERRRIFVFGVGEDLNAKLLDLLVTEHHGAAQYIRSEENLEIPLSNFFDKIDAPVLTDLELTFPQGGVSDVFPRPLPDLFRGEQLDVFGRYDTDGRKTVVLRGKLLGEDRVFEYSLEFKGGTNAHVPRLWGSRKIGYLLEQIRLSGESREVKDEVIRLSKLHGIITPYTSYLILEEDGLARAPAPSGLPFGRAALDAMLGSDGQFSPSATRLRVEAADAAERFGEDRGAGAVEASRELQEYKSGDARLGALRYLERTANAEGVRIVTAVDRTFYLQNDRWIDGALTTRVLKETDPVRAVKYLSDDYFALLEKEPGIGKFLAVGPYVTFVWRDEIISVVE